MGGLGEGALAPGPGQVTGSASSSVVELEGSPTEKVRASTAWVALMARHVHIDIAAAGALVDSLSDTEIDSMLQHEWDEGEPLTIPLNSFNCRSWCRSDCHRTEG